MKSALTYVLPLFLAVSCALAQTAANPRSKLDEHRPDDQNPAAAKTGDIKPSPPPEVLTQLNAALEGLVAKVSPAVVQILVTGYGAVNENSHTETALIARQHAVGSGVIVDADGYIMTNAHVVEGAQRIRVALPLPPGESPVAVPVGKRQLVEGKLIGLSKETDLALLKIDEHDLSTLPLESVSRVRVGEMVFAVGSPEGLQNSVTMGVVSAVGRQADPDRAMAYIQTDAPINPGNSGGPLVDMNGAVIGLNTFILSQGGGSEGLGFAIPAPVLNFVYRSLRKYGHVHRVEMGAVAQEITPDLAAGLHLPRAWGVIIADVTPDGPAATGGAQVQDIVLTADGRQIATLPQLDMTLHTHHLDQVFKLEVLRGNEKKMLYIPAVEHRDKMDRLLDAADPAKSLVPRLGILAIDLNDDLRSELGSMRISGGVVVVGRAADLIVADTGLQTGDVIHALNGAPVDSVETLRQQVQQLKTGDSVALQVERDGKLSYLAFEME